VNGINGRLPRLLEWLEETKPDVACLQELKAPQEKFPEAALAAAGYGAVWVGMPRWHGVALLARGCQPVETRRCLPGDPSDTQARYVEAAVKGVLIGCLYAPNGNPQPGPKFDYKLAWMERFHAYAGELMAAKVPAVLAGDYNIIPTDFDIYNTRSWLQNALLQPEAREAYARLLEQGWTDALRHLHPDGRIYTFWDYFRNAYGRDAGLRIDHFLLSPDLVLKLKAAGVDRDVRGREGASDHAPTWVELDL
jgi:exodeoxyribonuclease-3